MELESVEESLEVLEFKEFAKRIAESDPHSYYRHTIDLALKYKRIWTGFDNDELLKDYYHKDCEAEPHATEFKKLCKIFRSTAPAIYNRLLKPYHKAARVPNIIKEVEASNEDELHEVYENFHAGESLDKYLEERWTDLAATNPNSFTFIDWKEFDNTVERARPYPVTFYEEHVHNYSYENGELEWVMFRPNLEVEEFILLTDSFYGFVHTSNEDNKEKYTVDVFPNLIGFVPAFRNGFVTDKITHHKTNVSFFHNTVGRFEQYLSTVMNYTGVIASHAFPKVWVYAEDDKTERECEVSCGLDCCSQGCKKATLQEESILHRTADDIIVLEMPSHKDEMLPLKDLIYEKVPDVEFLRFQKECVKTFEEDIIKDQFNTNIYAEKTTGEKTATEVKTDYESVHDAIYPYTENFSAKWEFILKAMAAAMDIEAEVSHGFPRDLQLKTTDELLNEISLSDKANPSVRHELNLQLMKKINIDNPKTIRKLEVAEEHRVFKGKSLEEIQYLQSTGMCKENDFIRWAKLDDILEKIFQDNEEFYMLPYASREAEIERRIEELKPDRPNLNEPQ